MAINILGTKAKVKTDIKTALAASGVRIVMTGDQNQTDDQALDALAEVISQVTTAILTEVSLKALIIL